MLMSVSRQEPDSATNARAVPIYATTVCALHSQSKITMRKRDTDSILTAVLELCLQRLCTWRTPLRPQGVWQYLQPHNERMSGLGPVLVWAIAPASTSLTQRLGSQPSMPSKSVSLPSKAVSPPSPPPPANLPSSWRSPPSPTPEITSSRPPISMAAPTTSSKSSFRDSASIVVSSPTMPTLQPSKKSLTTRPKLYI